MTTAQREQKTERRRKDRGGEITGRRLGVAMSMLDLDKFVYRWINETPGRLFAKTQEDDWDVVMNDGVKSDSPDLGNAVSQIVGTHPDRSPLRSYLCRKPRGYFDDDQRAKGRVLDDQMTQLARGNDRDGASQSDYVPRTGIRLG